MAVPARSRTDPATVKVGSAAAAAARPGTTDETTSAAATRAARRAGMRFTLHSYGPSPDRGNRTGAHWHHKGSAPGVGRSGSYSTNQSPIPGGRGETSHNRHRARNRRVQEDAEKIFIAAWHAA